MTSWLVTGAGGMLGRDLVTVLQAAGESVIPATRADVDVTDRHAVDAAVARASSEAGGGRNLVVANMAAWTDVDGAERDEDDAHAVNFGGARNIARACAATGARMIYISTDYVFSGVSTEPYEEYAPVAPVSAYGRTKAAGERAVLETVPETGVILRTAWLYGAHGNSFARTLVRLAAEREHIDVVDDQVGQPTWTVDLAHRIHEVGRNAGASGIYHATNSGSVTWFGLAQAIFDAMGLDVERVRPTTSDRFPRPAARPAYSVLGHARWAELDMAPMRPWREALAEAAPAVLAAAGWSSV